MYAKGRHGMKTTADILVRSDTQHATFSGTLVSDPGENVVRFSAVMSSYDGTKRECFELKFPRSELDKVRLSDPDADRFSLLDDKGAETKYTFDWNSTKDPTGRFTVYTGQYTCGVNGESFDFTASTDPHPAVVIVGIIAAACLIGLAIDHLASNCREELSDAIRGCTDVGGFPQVKIGASFEFSFNPFQAGCGFKCELNCLPGESSAEVPTEIDSGEQVSDATGVGVVRTETTTTTDSRGGETVTTTTTVTTSETLIASQGKGGEQCSIEVDLEKVTIDNTAPTGNEWRLRIYVDGSLRKTYYPVAFGGNNTWVPPGDGVIHIKTTDRCGRMESVLIRVEAEQFQDINESGNGFVDSKAICTRDRPKVKHPRVVINVHDNNDPDNASSTLKAFFKVTWTCSRGTSSTAFVV
jgi:hypothetical protein